MMLAGCKKKEEEPVATQPAVTIESQAEAQTETPTEPETTELEPEVTVIKLPEDYIKSVVESDQKVNDNEEPKWMAFIWNDITRTADLKINGDKVQLQEGEKLIIYVPGGIESTSGAKELIEKNIYNSKFHYLEITFVEFSEEKEFLMHVTPINQDLEGFKLNLFISYNSETIVETEPSVDREFSEEMPYIKWESSEDVADYIWESKVGLIYLWEGNTEEGRGSIITNGERIYKDENQKILYSTVTGTYSYTILTPETASGKPFKGDTFEMAVINSDEEFDVKLLVEDKRNGTKTEFTFTIVP